MSHGRARTAPPRPIDAERQRLEADVAAKQADIISSFERFVASLGDYGTACRKLGGLEAALYGLAGFHDVLNHRYREGGRLGSGAEIPQTRRERAGGSGRGPDRRQRAPRGFVSRTVERLLIAAERGATKQGIIETARSEGVELADSSVRSALQGFSDNERAVLADGRWYWVSPARTGENEAAGTLCRAPAASSSSGSTQEDQYGATLTE